MSNIRLTKEQNHYIPQIEVCPNLWRNLTGLYGEAIQLQVDDKQAKAIQSLLVAATDRAFCEGHIAGKNQLREELQDLLTIEE